MNRALQRVRMMRTQRKWVFPKKLNTNRNAKKISGGFTIIELVVTIVIISIIAAIAVPSIIAFIRSGQQTNRMNIARTLYLAAQGELTSMRIDRSLENFGFDAAGDILSGHRLDTWLTNEQLPDGEGAFLHYITTANDRTRPLVMRLLQNAVVDRIVLEHAIVIEFNIETGVVLSVFYSDIDGVVASGLGYLGDGSAVANNPANISGSRLPYTHHPARRQGYFGVASTGTLPDAPPRAWARIFDGYRMPLDVGASGVARANALYAEFLLESTQGRFTFQLESVATGTPVVFQRTNLNLDPSATVASVPNDPLMGATSALQPVGADAAGIYFAGIDSATGLSRFVWVIDYIQGDLFNEPAQPHSLDKKFAAPIAPVANFSGNIWHTVRAVVRTYEAGTGTGAEIARSPMSAHTLFSRELPDSTAAIPRFEVASARHLNNMRYAPLNNNASVDSRFVQVRDIIMRDPERDPNEAVNTPEGPTPNCITSFVPIVTRNLANGNVTAFNGWYTAMRGAQNEGEEPNSQFTIQHLRIDTEDVLDNENIPNSAIPQNIGLFGELGNLATIQGAALFNAEIIAANANINNNVGSIAGQLSGGRITQSWSFANVRNENLAGVQNTGGLVGLIGTGGRLDQSFNAGFFNHHSNANEEPPAGTPSLAGVGFVNAERGHVGGLVGNNNGTILGSFNNARVNIISAGFDETQYISQAPIEPFSEDIAPPGGIAGINNGLISNSYATNLIGLINNGNDGYGIAAGGTGTGVRFINNYFIGNGSEGISAEGNNRNRRIGKEELADPEFIVSGTSPGSLTPALPGSIFVATDALYEEWENRYFGANPDIDSDEESIFFYPYPIIESNSPFERIFALGLAWGWEDVEGGMETPEARLVYYEVRNDGEATPSIRRFATRNNTFGLPSKFQTFETVGVEPLVELGNWVLHDGYCLELRFALGGYTIELIVDSENGDADNLIYHIYISGDEDSPQVEISKSDNGNSNEIDEWFTQVNRFEDLHFRAVSPTDDVLATYIRIFIPNRVMELAVGGVNIFTGTGSIDGLVEGEDDWENRIEEVYRPADFDPRFAPLTNPNYVRVRSPRHLRNITYVTNITRTYSQELDIDFRGYSRELNDNIPGLPLSTAPADLLTSLPNSVVNREFSYGNIYDGNFRLIRNVDIRAGEGSSNIGLFSQNGGRIRNITLFGASIRGGENVGAIVGTNLPRVDDRPGGYVYFCAVHTPVIDFFNPAPENNPITVQGVSNVGGIVGNNLGELSDVYLVSNSNRNAVQRSSGAQTTIGAIVGTTSRPIYRSIFLARMQSDLVQIAGALRDGAYIEDGYILSRTVTTGSATQQNRYSLNHGISFEPPSFYNDVGSIINGEGRHTFDMNIMLLFEEGTTWPWDGWAINDGISHDGMLRGDAFPYPYFAGTPIPTDVDGFRWPLVGTVSIEPFMLFYYERYAGTDYIGMWSSGGLNTLLYPTQTAMLESLGLCAETLFVVEDGYLSSKPIQTGGNNEVLFIHNRQGQLIFVGGPQSFSRPFPSGLFPEEMSTFAIMQSPHRHETFMDGRELVFIRAGQDIGRAQLGMWVNFRYAKAIFPAVYAPNVINQPYPAIFDEMPISIRSPRHLENISFQTPLTFDDQGTFHHNHINNRTGLGGNFVQELNINMDVHTTDALANRTIGTSADGRPNPNHNRYISVQYNATSGGGVVLRVRALTFARTVDHPEETILRTNYVVPKVFCTVANANLPFTGRFTALHNGFVSKIYNLSPTGEPHVRSIFEEIGEGGRVENLRLENNRIGSTATTSVVEAGGLASTNNGLINNIFMSNSQVMSGADTGLAGGIVANNIGTIRNTMFVSNAGSSPVTAPTYGNAAGVAARNTGTIDHTMYIALAPGNQENGIFPITGEAEIGEVGNDVFYLRGTHTLRDETTGVGANFANVVPANFNTAPAPQDSGRPATTHELHLMNFNFYGNPAFWDRDAIPAAEDIFQRSTTPNNRYPYHFVSSNMPTVWPIATNEGIRIVYFEDYVNADGSPLPENERRGYWTGEGTDNASGLPGLNTDPNVIIVNTGYGIIVPKPLDHTMHTVRVAGASRTSREVINRRDILGPINEVYYFEIRPALIYTNDSAIRMIVNDIPLRHDEVFFRNYAKAIFASDSVAGSESSPFAIRTPQQMLSISQLPGRNFILEQNLNFNDYLGDGGTLPESVVTGTFTGEFDGNGRMISNLRIASTAEYANVGLFSENSGTISNLTLDFGTGGHLGLGGRGHISALADTGSIVGAIAGVNNSIIEDVAIVSAHPLGIAPISGDTAGGIVGENTEHGRIRNVLYLARAPHDGTNIFLIGEAHTGSLPNIENIYYLSNPHVAIAPNDGGYEPITDFNTLPSSDSVGTSFYQVTIPTADSFADSDGETIWTDPPDPLNGAYPYPSLSGSLPPRAWPIGIPEPLPETPLEEPALYEQCECGEESCEHCESKQPDCGHEDCKPNECKQESDPTDPTDPTEEPQNDAPPKEPDDTNTQNDTNIGKPEDPYEPEEPKKPEDPYKPETPEEPEDSEPPKEPNDPEAPTETPSEQEELT